MITNMIMDQKQKKRLIIIVIVGVVLILITAFGFPELPRPDRLCNKTASYKWECNINLVPVVTGPLSLICKAQKGTWHVSAYRDLFNGELTGSGRGTCLLPFDSDAGMECTDTSQCMGRCEQPGGPPCRLPECVGRCEDIAEDGYLGCGWERVILDGVAVTRRYGQCAVPF